MRPGVLLRAAALAAAVCAAAVAAARAPRLCRPDTPGAWAGDEPPYRWASANGCRFSVATLADFQLAYAGRSLVLMGDSVSRDIALSVPMRYAGCDSLESRGASAEAVLGPDEVAASFCPARRKFNHQRVYSNHSFALPLGGHPDALAATVEFHWSRFLRDWWDTPVWRRFVVDGDFVPGRDALVLNGLFWHLALDHEKRFGMRNLTLTGLFPQWRREVDETVRRLTASPHAARLRQAVFWRTATWREWPGAGSSYRPAFDNYHINKANRYCRVLFTRAGFRVVETEKYSFHATKAPAFRGGDRSLVMTKDSVHFPPSVNLAMFREVASTVHDAVHGLWRGPAAALVGALSSSAAATAAAAGGGDRAAPLSPALAALGSLLLPGGLPSRDGGPLALPSAPPVVAVVEGGEDEDEGGGDQAALLEAAAAAAAATAAAGGGTAALATTRELDDDEEFGAQSTNASSSSDGSVGGSWPVLEPYGGWYGVHTLRCGASSGGGAGVGGGDSRISAPGGGIGGSRLIMLDEALLYGYMGAGAAMGALATLLVLPRLGRRVACNHPHGGRDGADGEAVSSAATAGGDRRDAGAGVLSALVWTAELVASALVGTLLAAATALAGAATRAGRDARAALEAASTPPALAPRAGAPREPRPMAAAEEEGILNERHG